MKIKEKLQLIKQLEEANIASIERYMNREDSDSLHAIIRRNAKEGTILREIAAEIIKDRKKGV